MIPVPRGLLTSSPTPGENGVREGKLGCHESPRAVNSYTTGRRGCLMCSLLEPAWPPPASRRREGTAGAENGEPKWLSYFAALPFEDSKGQSSQERQSLAVISPVQEWKPTAASRGRNCKVLECWGLGTGSRGQSPASTGGQVGWGGGLKPRPPCVIKELGLRWGALKTDVENSLPATSGF